MNKGHHPLADFLELQRKTAKGYACPVCTQTLSQEPKIWEHGVQNHPEYLGDIGSAEKADNARQRFRQEALDKAYVRMLFPNALRPHFRVQLHTCSLICCRSDSHADSQSFRQQRAISTGKASPAAAEVTSQRPLSGSNRAGVRKPIAADFDRRSALQPVSARGNSPGSGKRIDDIGNLSLNQTTLQEQKDRARSFNNPRKRGAEGESGSPEVLISGHNIGPMSTRPRHDKTISGGREADITPQETSPDQSEYKRGPPGTRQPLFDPHSDIVKGIRREKQHGHHNPILWRYSPTGLQSTGQAFGIPEKRANALPHAQLGQGKPGVSRQGNEGAKHSVHIQDDGEAQSSDSLDDEASGLDYPKSPDADPEMLLQPETRPISHEQLVVEVKGIYAGLVMVEAKCIDIDERQSAAAQEKDLSKRLELKDDQWQSLIALHKQVFDARCWCSKPSECNR